MVNQGDIIKLNFDPQLGHEQSGYRPALIVSKDTFNEKLKMAIACPISNSDKKNPLHVKLDSRTETTGFVMCDQIKSLDLTARPHKVVEKIPRDLLKQVCDIIIAEIEV